MVHKLSSIVYVNGFDTRRKEILYHNFELTEARKYIRFSSSRKQPSKSRVIINDGEIVEAAFRDSWCRSPKIKVKQLKWRRSSVVTKLKRTGHLDERILDVGSTMSLSERSM